MSLRRPPGEEVLSWLLGLALFAVLVGGWQGMAAGPSATAPAAPFAAPAAEPVAAPRAARPYFGELGAFFVSPVGDNRGLLACPAGYMIERATAAVRTSELFFALEGYPPVAATTCQDLPVFVAVVTPDQTIRRSYYDTPGPVQVALETPLERLQLLTVAGQPAIAAVPAPGTGRQSAGLFVLERPSSAAGEAPGVLLELRAEDLSLGELRSLAERIINQRVE